MARLNAFLAIQSTTQTEEPEINRIVIEMSRYGPNVVMLTWMVHRCLWQGWIDILNLLMTRSGRVVTRVPWWMPKGRGLGCIWSVDRCTYFRIKYLNIPPLSHPWVGMWSTASRVLLDGSAYSLAFWSRWSLRSFLLLVGSARLNPYWRGDSETRANCGFERRWSVSQTRALKSSVVVLCRPKLVPERSF